MTDQVAGGEVERTSGSAAHEEAATIDGSRGAERQETMTLAPIEPLAEESVPHEEEPRQLGRFTVAALAHEGEELAHHMVRSEYVEENWTAYLGPNAILLARKLDHMMSKDTKQRTAVQVKTLSAQLGISQEDVLRACSCLVRFGLAGWSERDSTFFLARRWPAVAGAIATPQHRETLLSIEDDVLR